MNKNKIKDFKSKQSLISWFSQGASKMVKYLKEIKIKLIKTCKTTKQQTKSNIKYPLSNQDEQSKQKNKKIHRWRTHT